MMMLYSCRHRGRNLAVTNHLSVRRGVKISFDVEKFQQFQSFMFYCCRSVCEVCRECLISIQGP